MECLWNDLGMIFRKETERHDIIGDKKPRTRCGKLAHGSETNVQNG